MKRHGRQLTIYCPTGLRTAWPAPLAPLWHRAYPQLFDDDDLRLTRRQPAYHFIEWFAAIHLFHQYGAHALLKKYGFQGHTRKCAVIDQLLGPGEREFLGTKLDGQAPDLFVYKPDGSEFWFVEVKGPRDRLRLTQLRNHERLERRYGVPVDVMTVKLGH
jgi:VRR-NUC domain-containing protein